MQKAIKINKGLKVLSKTIRIVLFLPGMLLISSCLPGAISEVTNPNNNNSSKIQPIPPASSAPMEVILFCGNPGVGKSSLCNSIFQQNVFESGISVGQGMTQQKQAYTYENRKYIDTPGLADINLRQQAAKEIEKALKENNNYKIIFVATLEAGRIKEADLVTINTVCQAIKAPFDYGIIFNKVTNGVIREIGENGENLRNYLTTLTKQPLLTVIIKKDADIEDSRNAYFPSDSENRRKLINFIDSLKANRIEEKQVEVIDVKAYQKKVEEMEILLKKQQEKYDQGIAAHKLQINTTTTQLEQAQKLQLAQAQQISNLTSSLNNISSQLANATSQINNLNTMNYQLERVTQELSNLKLKKTYHGRLNDHLILIPNNTDTRVVYGMCNNFKSLGSETMWQNGVSELMYKYECLGHSLN